jgi:hypothetical protein
MRRDLRAQVQEIKALVQAANPHAPKGRLNRGSELNPGGA